MDRKQVASMGGRARAICQKKEALERYYKNPNFNSTATLKEINDIDNLVALCPNCHWEYDHKILKLL